MLAAAGGKRASTRIRQQRQRAGDSGSAEVHKPLRRMCERRRDGRDRDRWMARSLGGMCARASQADRIEAGTYLLMALASGGEILLNGIAGTKYCRRCSISLLEERRLST